jgi:hypothetical protein
MQELLNSESIESCIFKYFKKNILIIQKMNVSGLLATEGYYFSI